MAKFAREKLNDLGLMTIQNIHQPVETLSGGQRQGVAVARAAAFAKRVLVNTMGMSTVVRVGADIKTAYEIDRYDGDRRTLARAIEYLNGVNGEIETVIRAQWPSAHGQPRRPSA